jgi:glycosyltransferase involved in cell wall biosynthesis
MKPLITALVDTYNHERYIEQALVSVVEQGLSPSELEILVVDDGSTDKTPAIIQKFVPRVRHLRKKNGGQASAFNAGFAQAQGRYIAILDSDDWWSKSKLETVIKALEEHPEAGAVSHAYYQYYEGNGEMKLIGPSAPTRFSLETPEAARQAFSNWSFLQPSALTVRRQLLDRIMPIPEVLVFSADSPIATASMAMGAIVLPQPLSYYRLHSDNLYAFDSEDVAKLRRKYEMDDRMCRVLWPMLLRLGVREECVAALLEPMWLWVNRYSLRKYGGSRLRTFRAEMQYFRAKHKNPSVAYKLFKWLVVGPATLLLPAQRYYKLQDWYAAHNLGQIRERLAEADATPHETPSSRPQER